MSTRHRRETKTLGRKYNAPPQPIGSGVQLAKLTELWRIHDVIPEFTITQVMTKELEKEAKWRHKINPGKI